MRSDVSPLRRWLVPIVGLLLTVGLAVWVGVRFYTDPTFLPPDDFLQYWASGRVLTQGGNPYDADQLYAQQVVAGRPDTHAVLMWNPPWTLALCLPISAIPARTAQLVWLLGQVLLMVWAVGRLWTLAGGSPENRWVAWGLVLTAPMTMFLLVAGQCSGWLLVGLTGFALAQRGRPAWAVLAVLCALKPHLFAPLWLAWILCAFRSRTEAARLMWGVGAGLTACALVTLVQPEIWSHYLAALQHPGSTTHRTLSEWNPPLLGYHLRMALAPDWFTIQFLPTILALIGTAIYWWTRRHDWHWPTELPRLVILGLLMAPYGAWHYDLLVLLVPIVTVAAAVSKASLWTRFLALALFVAFVGGGWVPLRGHWYVWMTPAVALGCLAMTRLVSTRSEPQPTPSLSWNG